MSNDVLCGYFAVNDLHEFPPSPSESPPTVKYNVLAKNGLNRLYAIITVASATIGNTFSFYFYSTFNSQTYRLKSFKPISLGI